jgi:hypothetical protein
MSGWEVPDEHSNREGYPPLPWVPLSFHFGPSRGEAKLAAAPTPVTSGARRFIPY